MDSRSTYADAAGEPGIRVLVADEDRLARIGLACLIGKLPGVEVAGEAADEGSIERLARDTEADVVVRGSFSLRSASSSPGVRARPEAGGRVVRTIVLGEVDDPLLVQTAFAAGADAFLVKSRVPELLPTAVSAVADGRRFLDPEIGARLAADLAGGERSGTPARITRREREVLALLSEGRTNDEIAGVLGISARTVEGHRTKLGRKLGFRRRAELVEYGILHRLGVAGASGEDGADPSRPRRRRRTGRGSRPAAGTPTALPGRVD